nr:hypothetical protein [Tanacetum cinerariifolium]
MKQEWKEIPFSFKLTVSNIEQQGVGSENLNGGVTESMSRAGLKEDHNNKVEVTESNDQLGLKEYHNIGTLKTIVPSEELWSVYVGTSV